MHYHSFNDNYSGIMKQRYYTVECYSSVITQTKYFSGKSFHRTCKKRGILFLSPREVLGNCWVGFMS